MAAKYDPARPAAIFQEAVSIGAGIVGRPTRRRQVREVARLLSNPALVMGLRRRCFSVGPNSDREGTMPTMRERVREARREVLVAAGRRYAERAPERSDTIKRLAKGGPAAAETPERVQEFRRRIERFPPGLAEGGLSVRAERMIGPALEFENFPGSEDERRAGTPVARIATAPRDGLVMEGFGTGFMVSPDLMMTNNHVLSDRSDARGVVANFGYEYTPRGLSQGVVFALDPDRLFLTDKDHDFTLVAVSPRSYRGERALSEFGHVRLSGETPKILKGQPINVIQYPNGGHKRYARAQNILVDLLDDWLHYTTDTMPGSSGSPAYSALWELVALHHSGVPRMDGDRILTRTGAEWDPRTMEDDDIDWVANEGARASVILHALVGLEAGTGAALLADLLRADDAAATRDATEERARDAAVLPMPAACRDLTEARMGQTVINIASATTVNVYRAGGPAAADGGSAAAVTTTESLVGLERGIRFDEDYANRKGYDERFLNGLRVPLPGVTDARRSELLAKGGRPWVIPYHHFSLVMNRERLLQMWSAVNVSYEESQRDDRSRDELGRDTWRLDPRVDARFQLEDEEFYGPARKFDRGHVVRREDNFWGAKPLAREHANSDTFHWTNCTPQHEAFNRSKLGGEWGELEEHIRKQADAMGDRLCILAGPVLAEGDPEHDFGNGLVIKYPLRFWKVLVIPVPNGAGVARLAAYGFILDQSRAIDERGLERVRRRGFVVPEDFEDFQISLAGITAQTGVTFDEALHEADVFGDARDPKIRLPIDKLESVRVRRPAA